MSLTIPPRFCKIKAMKRFFSFIFWIAVVGGLAYGGYYLYTDFWQDGGAEKLKGEVMGTATEKTEEIKEEVKGVMYNAFESVSEEAQGTLGNIVSSIGKTISSFGTNIVGEVISGGGTVTPSPEFKGNAETVEVKESEGTGSISPFASILIKRGDLFILSLNYGGEYEIDWGDNETEEGEVAGGKTLLLNHKWEETGEYTVTLSIKAENLSETNYSFPVFVYDD